MDMKKVVKYTLPLTSLISLLLYVILCIVTFYNYTYRIVLVLSPPILLLTSSIYIITLLLIGVLNKKVYYIFISLLTLVTLVIVILMPVNDIKQQITQQIIDNHYCNNQLSFGDEILGGMKVSNEPYSFINDSHCLIVVCSEELYYCNSENSPIVL